MAVLWVMLFHFGYFAAGWTGVQIFFVLSGYLITSGLYEQRGRSFLTFTGGFYWRRALRIFPLFYIFLLFVALTYAAAGAPASFPSDWPWLVTYTANFARLRDSDLGYAFGHLWSLALEEQFYLIWPFLVFFLPERALRWTVTSLLLLSPIIRLALFQGMLAVGHDAEYAGKTVYVLPFVQFDAFAAGAMIPLWGIDRMRNAGPWFLAILALTGAAGAAVLVQEYFWGSGAFVASLGYAMFLVQDYGYVWGYSLINVLSMIGIVCALQRWRYFRFLEIRPLVALGRISYGVYVYHIPLLLVGESMMKSQGVGVLGPVRPVFFFLWLLVVVLVSGFSFRWLEMPFLALKHAWPRAAVKSDLPTKFVR